MFKHFRSDIVRTLLTTLSLFAASAVPSLAATCESLTGVNFPDAKITTAVVVEPGAFQEANGRAQGANPYANLPRFCRVSATLTPSKDSDIKVEVWLPAEGWNSK